MRRTNGVLWWWVIAMACPLTLASCGPSGGDPDGGPPDAERGDGALPCGPFVGETPFGVQLRGSGTLTRIVDGSPAGVFEERVDVWFPEGRAAGAPAWVSHVVDWPFEAITVEALTLDAARGARFELSGVDGVTFELDGALVGPEGGVEVLATHNLAAPMDDRADIATGRAVLCTSAGPPPALLRAPASDGGAHGPLSPLSTFRVSPTAPWAIPPMVEVLAAGEALDVDIEVVTEVRSLGRALPIQLVAVRPRPAFPLGAPLVVRASGVDVLGRSYLVEGTLEVQSTSATLTDLTLDTPPPPGAVVGAHVEDGALRFGAAPGSVTVGPTRVLLALGDPPPGARHLRLAHRLVCASTAVDPLPRAALVTSDGAASVAELTCAPTPESSFTTLTLAVPGPGALHLVIDRDVVPVHPQTHPGYRWIDATVDDLAFE